MADYVSKYTGKEIDAAIERTGALGLGLSNLETEVKETRTELESDIGAHADQLSDHETRITNNYRSIAAKRVEFVLLRSDAGTYSKVDQLRSRWQNLRLQQKEYFSRLPYRNRKKAENRRRSCY